MSDFLWFEDPEKIDWVNSESNEIIEYKICRLLFGATCSPFVLTSMLIAHIESNSKENPAFAQKILSTLMISIAVLIQKERLLNCQQSSRLFTKWGFPLAKISVSLPRNLQKQNWLG